MQNELSKSLMCVQMRSGVEIWLEEETATKLQDALQELKTSKFVRTPDGRQTINTADVVGIFSAATMSEQIRRKNGEWQCAKGEWHKKFTDCECRSAVTVCEKCSVSPCVCTEKPASGVWQLSKPHFRDIHGPAFIEAYCDHGVGHHKGVHGCDGCCEHWPEDIASKVSID